MPESTRRSFLNQAAAFSAVSYARVRGANERISLGHIGIGDRGTELAFLASRLKDSHNVEMTAVCDLWTRNRDRAAAKTLAAYGRAPRAFQDMERLLELKDLDAVIVSTADFQHSPVLRLAARVVVWT